MIWFLRFFATFRSLEAALESSQKQLYMAQASGIRAEQEVVHLQSMNESLQGMVTEAHHDAISAVKTLANERWQRQYGTTLYQDALAQIPEARVLPSEPGSVSPGKTSVRLQTEAKYKQFLDEAEAQWELANRK